MTEPTPKAKQWFETVAIVFGLASPLVAAATTIAVDRALNGERIANLQAADLKHEVAFEQLVQRIETKIDRLDERQRTMEQTLARLQGGAR